MQSAFTPDLRKKNVTTGKYGGFYERLYTLL